MHQLAFLSLSFVPYADGPPLMHAFAGPNKCALFIYKSNLPPWPRLLLYTKRKYIIGITQHRLILSRLKWSKYPLFRSGFIYFTLNNKRDFANSRHFNEATRLIFFFFFLDLICFYSKSIFLKKLSFLFKIIF